MARAVTQIVVLIRMHTRTLTSYTYCPVSLPTVCCPCTYRTAYLPPDLSPYQLSAAHVPTELHTYLLHVYYSNAVLRMQHFISKPARILVAADAYQHLRENRQTARVRAQTPVNGCLGSAAPWLIHMPWAS